jgi:hypothetical protein
MTPVFAAFALAAWIFLPDDRKIELRAATIFVREPQRLIRTANHARPS